MMTETYGLEWQIKFLSPVPRWSVTPDTKAIESLARYHLALPAGTQCMVTFMAEGCLNKVYRIDHGSSISVFRVALPVDPRKVAGEVATLRWVAENTTIPVPTVIAFDTSNENCLRFPWILMTLMTGQPLSSVWRDMETEDKEKVVLQLASFNAQLFRRTFEKVGCIQERSLTKSFDLLESEEEKALLLVILPFFLVIWMGVSLTRLLLWRPASVTSAFEIERITSFRHYLEVPRQDHQPCDNSHAWLTMRLQNMAAQVHRDRLEAEEDDLDELETRLSSAAQIQAFLPRMFDPAAQDHTTLYHADLHRRNILVDNTGNITAILDWEFQYTAPTWFAAQFPDFLVTLRRHNAPDQEDYGTAESHLDPEEYKECRGISRCYWSAVEEYESTKLGAVYMKEMTRICPAWVHEYQAGRDRRLLVEKLMNLEAGFPVRIQAWLAGFDETGKCTRKTSTWKCEEEKLCHTEKFDEDCEAEEDDYDTSHGGECDSGEEE